MEPTLLRPIVNILASVVALAAIGVFVMFAPEPPAHSKLGVAGQPIVVDADIGEVTAFFEHQRGALRLTVLFDDPLDAEERLLRTSVSLTDGQRFSLVLGHEEDRVGRRYTFERSGGGIAVTAEDYPQPDFLRQLTPVEDPGVEMADQSRDAG